MSALSRLLVTAVICGFAALASQPVGAGQRYAERLVVPVTLGMDGDGHPLGMNQPAAGDLNRDGRDDVVFSAAWSAGGSLTDTAPWKILLNDGAGSYVDGTAVLIDGAPIRSWPPRKFLIADFNGDGRNDVFGEVTGADSPFVDFEFFLGGPNVLLLSGLDGKLRDATATNLPQLSDFSHGSTAADVDRDGDIDLWVNNLANENAPTQSYLLLNDGGGVFTVVANLGPEQPGFPGKNNRLPEALGPHSGALWSQFIDADDDGDPDLYLGPLPATGRTWLLLNDGTGRFADAGPDAIPPRTFGGLGQAENSFAADVDGDGLEDLLLFETPFQQPLDCPEDLPSKAVIAVLMSNGDGTFRDETFLRTPQSEDCRIFTIDFDIADINGDGAIDIAIQSFPTVEFLVNNGNGFFSRLPADWVDTDPSMSFSFIPVDVDNDGDSDFVENRELHDQTSLIRAIDTAVSTPNFAPVARADSYKVFQNHTLTIDAAKGVLANDVEPDRQAVTAVLVDQPGNGEVTLSADGGFSYTPGARFLGRDVFTYRADDGELSSSPAAVEVIVQPIDLTPILMLLLDED